MVVVTVYNVVANEAFTGTVTAQTHSVFSTVRAESSYFSQHRLNHVLLCLLVRNKNMQVKSKYAPN